MRIRQNKLYNSYLHCKVSPSYTVNVVTIYRNILTAHCSVLHLGRLGICGRSCDVIFILVIDKAFIFQPVSLFL